MAFSLTQEQRAAVENRGGALLVSAAAGSGKTRVLVERLLDRVEEGADIDRFLVITYTKAAAAELRGRIVEELELRLAARPGDRRLRRQATLAYKAQISTVHAFCASLLREFGHLLDVNPDFRLCDEGEAGVLLRQALDEVLEARYEALDPEGDFAQLVDTMSAGRDDSRLAQIVLDIRGRVQSHPDPAAWLDGQVQALDPAGLGRVGDTPWGALLLEDARRQGEYWLGRMAHALDLCACEENLQANYASSLSATLEGLRAFVAGTGTGWDEARAALPIPFPTVGRKKIQDCQQEAGRVKALRAACKKRTDKLADRFQDSGGDLMADLAAVYPAMRGLFALVKDVEAAFSAEKERRGLLDFSDLEHLAVRLLDAGASPAAQAVSARFEEIMVDEYQDTNQVQNAIFDALSRQGRNLFLVGDVKQSIYRFRLADPTIFLHKYRTFAPWERAAEGEPRRIILSKNFRSRPQVLEGVNFLFRNLMSQSFGEMDYTGDEALYPGACFPPGGGDYAVELDALDLSAAGEAEGERPARDLLEARFAARRIRALVDEGFPVSDGAGGLRPVRPADVVILLRSPGSVLHHYARALGERDLLWEAEGGGDFFAATEIQVALALLEVVDNPRQDVPLIAALRSPAYAFSADRLALLRAACPGQDFYTALAQGADRGEGDCAAFLEELAYLRDCAGDRDSHELIWHIYDRTNLLGIFGAMDRGEERRANLLTLAELARKFEGAGHRGLFGFLSYLARLRESGGKIAVPAAGREGGGVGIMSIHRSKGLEFPVVLVCGLARLLNREDMQQPVLFHPKLGVGPKRLDTGRMIEYPTLARMAVARQLEYEMMAEELRLLYVALTRAREKLILSCALTGGGQDMEKLLEDVSLPVDPQALLGCRSVAQWVLLPVLARPEAALLRDRAGMGLFSPADGAYGPGWDIRWVDGELLLEAPASGMAEAVQAADAPDLSGLAERLAWHYPHRADVEIPSKLTATQIKGRALDQEVAEEAGVGEQARKAEQKKGSFRRPRFAQEEWGLTPAQKGTALHLVMQYLDFDRAGTAAQVAEEIRRLEREQFITPQQAGAVPPGKIAAFFTSPLGRELMAAPNLRREFKFSLLVPAGDYYPQAGAGEQVLLQGVVDCCFETLEGLTVVDFKTDRVSPASLAARAEGYRPQLAAYARALEVITGRPVARRVLWFFDLDRAVEL